MEKERKEFERETSERRQEMQNAERRFSRGKKTLTGSSTFWIKKRKSSRRRKETSVTKEQYLDTEEKEVLKGERGAKKNT